MPTGLLDLTDLRVLVVDDDDDIVGICMYALAAADARPFGALDAQAACQLLAETQVDVLVSDLVMPGLTGRKFLDWLGDTHPGIPVVAMSGVPDQVHAAAARHNVRATLDKPFTADELLDTIGIASNRAFPPTNDD